MNAIYFFINKGKNNNFYYRGKNKDEKNQFYF